MSRIDEFSRLLGSIEESTRQADGHRRELREKVDEIADQLRALVLDVTQDRAVATQERATIALERAETRAKLERVDERLEKIEPVVTKEFDAVKADVATIKGFTARVGAIIPIATALMSGAVWLLWQGVTWLFTHIDIGAIINRLSK